MYIIFPTDCMASPSGLMVGMKDETGRIACVVNVVSPLQSQTICRETGAAILGYWCRVDCSSLKGIPRKHYSKLVLLLRQGRRVPEAFCTESEEVVLILYNRPSQFIYLATIPLSLRQSASETECEASHQGTTAFRPLPLPKMNTESHTEEILEYVNRTTEMDTMIKTVRQSSKRYSVMKSLYGFLYYISIVQRVFLDILAFISNILFSFSNLGIFKWRGISFLVSLPVFLIQCSLRRSQISFLSSKSTGNPQQPSQSISNSALHRTKGRKSFEELHEKQRHVIITGNVVASIILDVLLGIAVVISISSSSIISDIAKNLVQYTDYIAQLLTQLIHWMMGVPGGLKLNKTLTNFLGKFFLYHIYLWQTYLQVIQPYLQTVLWFCIMSGCLGMTFLISMASDVFSLLTLHIYFFYVYAARLYSLQIYAILSLARLFTGKKWNVLRNRVDSLPYDVDHLFIGTLLFTVLLFLLPTTALFYVVFTTLRLMVLVLKSLLSSVTHLLNKLPLFGLVLLMLRPSMLPAGLHIEILQAVANDDSSDSSQHISPHLPPPVQALYLKLFNKPLSISQLLDWSISMSSHVKSEKQDTWGAFLRKLVRGQLVYPWIERD